MLFLNKLPSSVSPESLLSSTRPCYVIDGQLTEASWVAWKILKITFEYLDMFGRLCSSGNPNLTGQSSIRLMDFTIFYHWPWRNTTLRFYHGHGLPEARIPCSEARFAVCQAAWWWQWLWIGWAGSLTRRKIYLRGVIHWISLRILSGKLTVCYGKSRSLLGKSTWNIDKHRSCSIAMSSYVEVQEGILPDPPVLHGESNGFLWVFFQSLQWMMCFDGPTETKANTQLRQVKLDILDSS